MSVKYDGFLGQTAVEGEVGIGNLSVSSGSEMRVSQKNLIIFSLQHLDPV